MTKQKRYPLSTLLCLLCALCLASPAYCEAAAWFTDWATLPVEVTLTIQEDFHLPLDDVRTAELNRLLSHIGLRLRREVTDLGEWQSLALLVDETESARLTVYIGEAGSQLALETEDRSLTYHSALPDLPKRLIGYEAFSENELSLLFQEKQATGADAEAIHAIGGSAHLAGMDASDRAYTLDVSNEGQVTADGTAEGTISFAQRADETLLRQGKIEWSAAQTSGFAWQLPGDGIDLDSLSEDALKQAQAEIQSAVTRSLIRHIALLWPASESAYLNRDLDDWQSIVREAIRPSDWEE